jgi:hypothetical protein
VSAGRVTPKIAEHKHLTALIAHFAARPPKLRARSFMVEGTRKTPERGTTIVGSQLPAPSFRLRAARADGSHGSRRTRRLEKHQGREEAKDEPSSCTSCTSCRRELRGGRRLVRVRGMLQVSARHRRARRSGAGRRGPRERRRPGPPARVLCALGWSWAGPAGRSPPV